ncbi:unnamed protein product [Cyprideis torosa]|uniref:Uncharacterized protein n=1 Tax=Cyprideis torosa TaxID=163714 RepID=A0A7R8ZU32_9CRUS|nr:unnamed protein product [Cyprideis torosa]CAG0899411.1 unnamed protein product [Cyprideis torosa]
MDSQIQKEPSGLEVQSLDQVSHFTKSEDFEVPNHPNDFSGLGETLPLKDVIPGSKNNGNQTCEVPDQIEHWFSRALHSTDRSLISGDGAPPRDWRQSAEETCPFFQKLNKAVT